MPSADKEDQQYRFGGIWYPRYFFTRRQLRKPVPKPIDGPQWKLRLYENLYESNKEKRRVEDSPLHRDLEELFRQGMSWKEVDAILKPLLGETEKQSRPSWTKTNAKTGQKDKAYKTIPVRRKSLRRKSKILEKSFFPQNESPPTSERLIKIIDDSNVESKTADEEISIEPIDVSSSKRQTLRESSKNEWAGVFYTLYNKLEKFSLIRV